MTNVSEREKWLAKGAALMIAPTNAHIVQAFAEGAMAALAAQQDAWQPIETAPKDGTQFLGYFEESDDYAIVTLHDPGGAERNPKHNYECWVVSGSPCGPSHWKPLTKPEAIDEQ